MIFISSDVPLIICPQFKYGKILNLSCTYKSDWHTRPRPHPQATTVLLSVSTDQPAFSRVFYKWNRIHSLGLICSTQHNDFETRSRCGVPQWLLPLVVRHAIVHVLCLGAPSVGLPRTKLLTTFVLKSLCRQVVISFSRR